MGTAILTGYLGATHEKRFVLMQFDIGRVHWPIKTRPPGTRLELGVRGEQRLPTRSAFIHSSVVVIMQSTCEGTLCTLLTQDMILLRCELFLPIGLWLIS